jgi:hypothetical protein
MLLERHISNIEGLHSQQSTRISYPTLNRTSTSTVTPTAHTALYPNPTFSGPGSSRISSLVSGPWKQGGIRLGRIVPQHISFSLLTQVEVFASETSWSYYEASSPSSSKMMLGSDISSSESEKNKVKEEILVNEISNQTEMDVNDTIMNTHWSRQEGLKASVERMQGSLLFWDIESGVTKVAVYTFTWLVSDEWHRQNKVNEGFFHSRNEWLIRQRR